MEYCPDQDGCQLSRPVWREVVSVVRTDVELSLGRDVLDEIGGTVEISFCALEPRSRGPTSEPRPTPAIGA